MKYLTGIVLFVCLAVLSSCSSSLQNEADEYNKSLPKEFNKQLGMTMEKVAIENDALLYNISVDENLCSVDSIKSLEADIKGVLKEILNDGTEESTDMVEECKDENMSIGMKFYGKESKKEVVIKLNPNEF